MEKEIDERFKIEIPWNKFNEEEIQTIIATLFHSLDYNVEQLHKSDRANEGGADIVVKKGDETTAIAVKIKPDHKDRYQLLELSRRKEKNKVYVYIQTPTKNFMDSMKSDGNNIEFWDVKKLNDFFVENNLYLTANIIFENHKISQTLQDITRKLCQLWLDSKKLEKREVKPISKKSFSSLWRLKDAAVTLHQTNALIRDSIFAKPINFKNKELNEHFLSMFVNYLNYLEEKIHPFIGCFLEFLSENENLVYNSIIENSLRSHWLWIASYQPLNNLNTLKKGLENSKEERKVLLELEESLSKVKKSRTYNKDLDDHYNELAKSNDVWKAINHQIEGLRIIGDGIEWVIDDITEEYFKEHKVFYPVTTHDSDKKSTKISKNLNEKTQK